MKATKSLFGILTIAAALAGQVHAQGWLTNGLVAYYPFNGNANDASGNGHNGVVNGTSISPTTNQLGVSPGALHFGGGSYISVTPTPFNVNSNWTISFWCILDANDGPENFVCTGNDNQGGVNMRYVYGSPIPWQFATAGFGYGCSSTATNAATIWNMFTCVRSGDLYEMFLNNVRLISTNVVATCLDAGSLWFGRHQGTGYDLVGSLSEMRIYNRGLSDFEVQQLYAIESPPTAPFITSQPRGQVGYWGKSVIFTVTAAGSVPLSYQWLKDNAPIGGASESSLVLTNLQLTNAGNYSVVVTNAYGSTASSNAYLTMNPAGVSLALYPGVTIDGVVGLTYGIQYTTDLSNTNSWKGLVNVPLSAPTMLWFDTQPAMSQPQRYYRVVPGPISIP